jgi:hypothetical protein
MRPGRSFLGETLARLGVGNIVPGMGPFPKINPEFVVRADPDVIMVGDANFTGMTSAPAGPACARSPAAGVRVFGRPSPTLHGAPRAAHGRGRPPMARCLQAPCHEPAALALTCAERPAAAARSAGRGRGAGCWACCCCWAHSVGSTGFGACGRAHDPVAWQIVWDIRRRAPWAPGWPVRCSALAGAVPRGCSAIRWPIPFCWAARPGASLGVGRGAGAVGSARPMPPSGWCALA